MSKYAHAHAVYFTMFPASQRGVRANRFAVVAFLTRKDNRGNARMFRYMSEHVKLGDARKAYAKRFSSGKYLYGELIRLETLEAMETFGDDSAEDRWLDDNQR